MTQPAQPKVLHAQFDFDGVTLSAFTRTVDGKEQKFIGGTASSTAQDLYGSFISEACQAKMMTKLEALTRKAVSGKQSGMTGWLNHRYTIPEDVLGTFTSAKLVQRTSDGADGVGGGIQGETYIDLDIELKVYEDNPRALEAWKQVQAGVRHGWSIGAIFLDYERGSDDWNEDAFWELHVNDIELLEISLVGMPANQRAWCRSADDLKAQVIKTAERIIRAPLTHERAERMAFKLPALRDMVIRSLVSQDDDDALEARAMAHEFRRLADEPSDEATEEDRDVLLRVADKLDVLRQRTGDDGGETSPDDIRDKVAMAISHAARAVGHGLCIRSATHVARCIDCLGMVVGANGGAAEPTGDEDPVDVENAIAELRAASDAFSATATKLDPKAGVVLAGAADLKGAIDRVLGLDLGTKSAARFGTFAVRTAPDWSAMAEAGLDERGIWIGDITIESADPKKPYGNVHYADPGYLKDGVHRYPLDTDEHIKAAASYFGQTKNRDQYTQSQQKAIEARIHAAEKRHGIGDAVKPDDIETETQKAVRALILNGRAHFPENLQADLDLLETLVATTETASPIIARQADLTALAAAIVDGKLVDLQAYAKALADAGVPGASELGAAIEAESWPDMIVAKMRPEAGDLLTIKGIEPAELSTFGDTLRAAGLADGVVIMALPDDAIVNIEQQMAAVAAELVEKTAERDRVTADLTARSADLATLDAAVAEAGTVRSDIEAAIVTATAERDALAADIAKLTQDKADLEKAIAERQLERAGRVSKTFAAMRSMSAESYYVDPKYYSLSPAQVEAALKRQAAGNTEPLAGRDRVV